MTNLNESHMPSEEEIMNGWHSEEVKVSVLCVSYNHEKYLPEAIESFLTQKTDFAYEIVIHDDASTDGSASVIKYYQSLYPNIIKPILQQENQYSRAPNSIFVIGAESCSSEYIALCEGDDYWISKDKLQIQYEALKKQPDLNFSFHSYEANNNNYVSRSFLKKKVRTIPLRKMISRGPAYVALGSVMVKRRKLISVYRDVLNFPIGDYLLQVLASHPAGALYVSGLKSYYRTNSSNSWSEKAASSHLGSKVEHWRIMSKGLLFLDECTNYNCSKEFSFYNFVRLIRILKLVGLSCHYFSVIIDEYLKNEKSTAYRAAVKLLFGFGWSFFSLSAASFFIRARSSFIAKWVAIL